MIFVLLNFNTINYDQTFIKESDYHRINAFGITSWYGEFIKG